jgi:hypothetical protein
MAQSLSWLAFQGKSRGDVLAALHLFDTGTAAQPDSEIVSATLAGDWTVVRFQQFGHPYAEDSSVAHFSKGCSVLACHVEESLLFSAAQFYRRGRMVWSVFHAGEDALSTIEVEGAPPEALNGIVEAQKAKQAAIPTGPMRVDFLFEVPLELARQVCGFRQDAGEAEFTELRDWSERQ